MASGMPVAKSIASKLRAELRGCQQKLGDFQTMELLSPDLNGILKRLLQEFCDEAA